MYPTIETRYYNKLRRRRVNSTNTDLKSLETILRPVRDT